MQLPAHGLSVLNAGVGLSPALVARLCEEVGAQVRHGPGVAGSEHRYPGLRVWAASRLGGEQLEASMTTADVIIVGGESPAQHEWQGMAADDVARVHPRAVVLSIEGYLPGVAQRTPAVDLLVQARTGLTGEISSASPTPVAFAPTLYGAALLGFIGVWAALVDRIGTGRGQVVRTTLQQGAALFWPHLWMTSDAPSREFDTVPPLDVRHLVFRCADGRYVQIVLGVPSALLKLYRGLGIPGTVDPADRGAPDPSRPPENYFGDRRPIAEAVGRLASDEVVDRLADVGIPAGLVSSIAEMLGSAQARANDLVRTDHAGARWGGNPVSVTAASAGATPPASGRTAWRPGPGRIQPLQGLRVVDFGNWVAGPFATKLLADLGADVVSVDPPTGLSNLTGVRNLLSANRGKRSVELDLKSEEGRTSALALVADADVVCHNFRVGVAERLGLGADSLHQLNQDVVLLHTSAFGQRGPWATRGGFDMVGQALGGHELRAGGEGNEPLWTRSPFIDYGTGALGAGAVLAALFARLRTNQPQRAHVSLLGTALFLRSDCYLDESGSAQGQLCLDHDRLGFTPGESLYRTDDGWLALVLPDAKSARAIAGLVGLTQSPPWPCWGAQERMSIARWLRGRSTAQALRALTESGAWATQCRRDEWEALGSSGHPGGDQFVIEVDDPRFGRVRGVFGPQVWLERFSRQQRPYRSAPLAGQHTHEVLMSVGDLPSSIAAPARRGAGNSIQANEKIGPHSS